jgi:uncharacterized DUF497 family protein
LSIKLQPQLIQWDTALVSIDDRYDYGEPRLEAIGLIGSRLHVLVFNLRETTVRIISLRKANRREVRHYVERQT